LTSIPEEYSEHAMAAALSNEREFSNQIRLYLRKQRSEDIKLNVEKIIKKIDKNGHNVFKVLKESNTNHITCLLEENDIITDSSKIE
jgi:hypothetical protein